MEGELVDATTAPHKSRKRRIPKACGSCRQSKVRCDGQRPCSRCRGLRKVCKFTEPPKDEQERKIESLETEVELLREKLQAYSHRSGMQQERAGSVDPASSGMPPSTISPTDKPVTPSLAVHHSNPLLTPSNATGPISPTSYGRPESHPTGTSPSTNTPLPPVSATNTFKRKWSHLKVEPIDPPDFVSMGLFSEAEAESYFNTFFQGCNQYVPVFDQRCDSLQEIRSRSSLLFSTICAVGCRVLKGTDSHEWRLLNFYIKRALNSVIGTPESATLETVQALLVRACYVSERSLFVTLATRLAVDLGLPDAYEQLSTRFVARIRGSDIETRMGSAEEGDSLLLMRKARTWLHLLVLGHMLHVDASDLLTFKFNGDVRRCRVLLDGRFSTDLDLHLFSQVELNVLRANTYATLSNSPDLSDDEIMDIVRDAKIDIDLWFNDWMSIFERSQSQKRQLSVNIRIQRCWADTMVLCRAVRVSGVENVDAMSTTQRGLLIMAKDALTEHLSIIIEDPREYLHNLRFAMDFVWAKCAFCLLLLFKLSMLLAEDDEQTKRDLIERGKTLLTELHNAGGTADGGRSGTSRLYIQLLQTGIEKYGRTVLNENVLGQTDVLMTGTNTPRQRTGAAVGSGGHNELESFVPEQFVFEWDFPGLTLFSSRATEAGWLDDFLRGALIGEDFYGLGWNSADDV